MSDDVTAVEAASAPRWGVAVLYLGDIRALSVTMRSLDLLTAPPDRIVIVEQPFGRRASAPVSRVTSAPALTVGPQTNPRAAALDELADCDFVTFIREGLALAPAALAIERERFRSNRALRAALLSSRRRLELDAYLALPETSSPFEALEAHGKLAGREPRYFTPCLLSVATRRGPLARFEKFAQRSEWASSRLFLDGLEASTKIEALTDGFGLIANDPDRRDTALHGREACEALFRFGAAHPSYRPLAHSDVRRMIRQQIFGILRGSRPRVRYRFLLGILSGIRSEAAMRRRVARDIADLA